MAGLFCCCKLLAGKRFLCETPYLCSSVFKNTTIPGMLIHLSFFNTEEQSNRGPQIICYFDLEYLDT